MKHTKTIEVPATTSRLDDGHTCDRCKTRFERTDDGHNGVNWASASWGDIEATRVVRTEGNSWPEGTNLRSREWHICPKCFDEWLMPILVEQCGDGEVSRTDY